MKTQIQRLFIGLVLFAGVNALTAQNTAFTYQGRVTDDGTNFNGTGHFEFALVTSTNTSASATATANAPSGGYITGYALTYAGNGYTGSTVPLTITGGGGSGAAAHGNISGGMVTSITVDNPGNGSYSSAPTVTIAAPPADITYTTYWSNDGRSVAGSEPYVAINVTVNSGLFTVVLGDTTILNMAAIDASLFSQPNLQLRIWFSDGVSGFAALDPVQNLTPAPYAVNAVFANAASNLVSGLSIQENADGAPNVIGGASVNYVSSGVVGATIGGGGATNYSGSSYSNSVTAEFGTVGGGAGNTASGNGGSPTVGGGVNNNASGNFATMGGGYENTASGSGAFIGGGGYDGTTTSGNNAIGNASAVVGGLDNSVVGNDSIVGGGSGNNINAGSDHSTIAGGNDNTIQINAFESFVGGGQGNVIGSNATWSAIGGGLDNTIQTNASYSFIGGGQNNYASGNYSFAAGQQARALHQGAFVWADSQNATFSSTTNDQFLIRAQGGVGIGTASPQVSLDVAGGIHARGGAPGALGVNNNGYFFGSPGDNDSGMSSLGDGQVEFYANSAEVMRIAGNNVGIGNSSPGYLLTVGTGGAYCNGTTWVNGSDRNSKEDFAAINPREVLAKVSAMPITEWKYKVEPDGTEHLGPMAQDFHAAFGLNGADDKHISTVDEGGVALAAIQGLNEKLQETRAENTELKQRLDRLEQIILKQKSN